MGEREWERGRGKGVCKGYVRNNCHRDIYSITTPGGSLTHLIRSLLTVLKLKQALSGRVTVAHSTVVDEGDVAHPPPQQGSSDRAAEGARAEEETTGLLKHGGVESRPHTPLGQERAKIHRWWVVGRLGWWGRLIGDEDSWVVG